MYVNHGEVDARRAGAFDEADYLRQLHDARHSECEYPGRGAHPGIFGFLDNPDAALVLARRAEEEGRTEAAEQYRKLARDDDFWRSVVCACPVNVEASDYL